MSKTKVTISVLSVIFIAVCLALSFWYYWIAMYGPAKTVVNTFNVGELSMADGSKQQIMSVKYHSNKNNNGLEMFEIKLNYFSDESRENFSSQGMQFVANTVNDNITWASSFNDANAKYYREEGNWFTGYKKYYEVFGSYAMNNTYSTVYNYSSTDDGAFGKSTNPISEDSFFRIQIGEDIYGLEFKNSSIGRKYKFGSVQNYAWDNMIEKTFVSFFAAAILPSYNINEYYYSANIYYLSKLLYENATSYAGGSDMVKDIELPDLFNYTKWTGSTYEPVTNSQEIIKVRERVMNNYAIHFEISNDGAQIASDSMFGLVHNDPAYRISEDVFDDYFYGNETIKVDIYDFDFQKILNNNVVLKLNDKFVNYYSKYSKVITLSVEIDLDKMEELGYKFYAFAENSGLEKFKVKEIYTLKSGQREEVEL